MTSKSKNTPVLKERKDKKIRIVSDDESKELSTDIEDPNESKSQGSPLKLLKSIKGLKLNQIRLKLTEFLSADSAATTALTTVFPLKPANTGEWSSITTLYSECKVHAATCNFFPVVDPLGTTAPQFGILTYDPLDATALSSVLNGMSASSKYLYTLAGSISGSDMIPTTKRGFYTFKMKVPDGSSFSVTNTLANAPGSWTDTRDSADNYGYLAVYQPAVVTSYKTYFRGYLTYDISF